MSPRIVSGLSRAFFDSDLIAARLILFIGEVAWAVMLWWPGDTFARPTYGAMGKVAPELVWALAFSVSAVLQLRIVVFEQQHTTAAHIFAAWNALLWCSVVGMMLHSVYPPPAAIGAEIASACAAVWIAVRPFILARGARHACTH